MLRRCFSVAIYASKRTPIGSFQGKLSRIPAVLLGAHALAAACAQAKPARVDEVIFGSVLGAGQGLNPARQCALAAGLPEATVATTIAKGDSSGLKAVTLAAERVMLEPTMVVGAGGFDSCSLAPHVVAEYRRGALLGDVEARDCLLSDTLMCLKFNVPAGLVAEKTAVKFDLLRREQDLHAKESYIRAMSAWERKFFSKEVQPIEFLTAEHVAKMAREDEYYTRIDFEKMKSTGALYTEIGSVTGANSAALGDGGAAVILGSEDAKVENPPLARLLAWADCSTDPEWFPLSIAQAIHKLCTAASFPLDRVNLFEIDENLSISVLANIKELGLNSLKVNVNGGSVALGHPPGMTGARMLGTLIYGLKERDCKYGVVATCEVGGGATAVLVEVP